MRVLNPPPPFPPAAQLRLLLLNCSKRKQTSSKLNVFFLISFSRLYQGIKLSFEKNTVGKSLFLSACRCRKVRIFFTKLGPKIQIRLINGCGDSSFELFFVIPKYSDCLQHCMLQLGQCGQTLAKVRATVT